MKGSFTKRILLFVATNLAVVALLAVVAQLFGLESILAANGVGLSYESLLVFSAVIGFGGAGISLVLSKKMAKWSTGARVIEQPRTPTEAWLVSTVHRFAREAGIGRPEVAIYDSPDPNAFATGARRNHALVAVSTGLLDRMEPYEVEAVLAHEVAHVANGDMITMTLLQGVLNTFVVFVSRIVGFLVDRLVFRTERGHGPGFFITSIVAQLLLGVAASAIVMAYSRRREYRADAGAAELVGAGAMIAALERLRAPGDDPADLPDTLQAFGIRGGAGGALARLFRSHPDIDERIEALQASSRRAPLVGGPARA